MVLQGIEWMSRGLYGTDEKMNHLREGQRFQGLKGTVKDLRYLYVSYGVQYYGGNVRD